VSDGKVSDQELNQAMIETCWYIRNSAGSAISIKPAWAVDWKQAVIWVRWDQKQKGRYWVRQAV
jgi:hypothetical protein